MPYIAIKAYPKDEETKKRVVEQIQEIFVKTWGCPAPAITISIEEFPPEDFDKKVREPEILPKLDKMMILDGEKSISSNEKGPIPDMVSALLPFLVRKRIIEISIHI